MLVEDSALSTLAELCDGDARSALNGLQLAVEARRTQSLQERSRLLPEDAAKKSENSKSSSSTHSKDSSSTTVKNSPVVRSDSNEIETQEKSALSTDPNNSYRANSVVSMYSKSVPSQPIVTVEDAKECLQRSHLVYDRAGEEHYNIISALHKSMRGSDANASLYWLARMLCAGEDPLYVARRIVRFASEDIGELNRLSSVCKLWVYEIRL